MSFNPLPVDPAKMTEDGKALYNGMALIAKAIVDYRKEINTQGNADRAVWVREVEALELMAQNTVGP